MWPHIFLLWYSCLCCLSSTSQIQALHTPGLPSSQETTSEERNLTTLLVCEGGQANLSCPTGQHILIHLANFGRFSLQPCNPTLTWRSTPSAIMTIPCLCSKLNVKTVKRVFYQLVGHFHRLLSRHTKYLEAVYGCQIATTTTSTTTAQTTSAIAVVEEEETRSTVAKKKPEIRPKEYCSSQSSRHILWPSNIRLGHLARLACPAGSRGQAEWMCSLSGQWHPSSGPDLSKCVSDWSRQLKQDLEEGGEDPLIRLETIREVHSHVRREQLLGGDLMDLVQTTSKAIKNFGERPELELELAKLVVDTAGYLLRESQQEAWMDLPRQERRRIADLLVHAVEHALLLLFPLDKGRSELLIAEPTVMAEVAAVGVGEYDVPFPSMSLYRENLDSVVLPREVLQMGALDQANVMYTAYDNILGSYLTISEPILADAFHKPASSYQPIINSHKTSEFKTPMQLFPKCFLYP
uniref:SUEL-type lectin domain-containing protein n=1 Tax=Ditylenchus dipsaci TaxID=166011 RepID=A0A915D0W3_9BILA